MTMTLSLTFNRLQGQMFGRKQNTNKKTVGLSVPSHLWCFRLSQELNSGPRDRSTKVLNSLSNKKLQHKILKNESYKIVYGDNGIRTHDLVKVSKRTMCAD